MMNLASALRPKPLNLPPIVLISGGVNTKELSSELVRRNHEHSVIYLRNWSIHPDWDPITHEKSAKVPNLTSLIAETQGVDFFVKFFLQDYVDEFFLGDECFIFPDGDAIADLPALVSHFGHKNVLLIMTGEMKQVPPEIGPNGPNFIWLPLSSSSERMKLLERELGIL